MAYTTVSGSTSREPVPVESVSQITARLKRTVESGFARVAVEGELSGCKPHRNGHLYTKLKDSAGTLSVTVWRSTLTRIRFDLEDGLQVIAYGKIEIYPPNGSYSLIVDRLEPVGQGSLDLAFRQICDRLRSEGLFEESRKRELPRFPQRVVVISSATSAALRDFWRVARDRWPLADILVIDTPVQGDSAAAALTSAVRAARDIPDVSSIVITRGGGSREDLWCFNDEALARAIAASPVPVVSAVGHEVDTSVSDLVADVRAATPTHAATMIFPDVQEVLNALDNARNRLSSGMTHRLHKAERLLEQADRRLIAAGSRIADRAGNDVSRMEMRLKSAMQAKLNRCQSNFERQVAVLESLSPLKVLTRGYSVTIREDSGTVVRKSAEIEPGTAIWTELTDGRVRSVVESLEPRHDSSVN
jgi:exodeoxyribonuclease VII large subunit